MTLSKNVLKYKGYIARIEFSADDQCLHGRIEGISDLVTFESTDAASIEQEFHDAVDDYLSFCAEVGKEPDKHYSGTFNVRIDQETHRALEYYAISHSLTLNAVVSEACESFVRREAENEISWATTQPFRETLNNPDLTS